MELKTIISNGKESVISVPSKQEMGKLLLSAKVANTNVIGHGLSMTDLDFWTDKNLTVEERRFSYLNKQQEFNSDSDEYFTEVNIITIVGWFLFWGCIASFLTKVVFMNDVSNNSLFGSIGLGLTGFMATVYFFHGIITHPKQKDKVNLDRLLTYLAIVVGMGLLFSLVGVDWFVGMILTHYVYSKLCVCPNYYVRKKVYL